MLLTLTLRSLRDVIDDRGGDKRAVYDIPAFAVNELAVRGLNIHAAMLTGWGLADLDQLRDRADKAGCPCLVLMQETALDFAARKHDIVEEAHDRIHRLAVAAHRLGCNALAIRCNIKDKGDAFDQTAMQLKRAMSEVERLELNLLIAAHDSLTAEPERLTDLIKRVGGFRIGSLPEFEAAEQTGDTIAALRHLAPYAGAIHATITEFTKAGKHKGADLAKCVAAIKAVGFANNLAIDYTGGKNSVKTIETARDILKEAIEAEE